MAGLVVLLALAAAVLAPPAARAGLLIGNLNVSTATTTTSPLSSTRNIAQGFTTGSNTGGYTLESVSLWFDAAMSSGDTGDLTVTLRSDSDPAGDPGALVATFTNPASVPNADEDASGDLDAGDAAVFTAPAGTGLDANTTYYVMVDFDQTGSVWGGA